MADSTSPRNRISPPSRRVLQERLVQIGPLTLAAVLLAGFFFGWLVMGWVIWPVEWSEVYPNDLRQGARSEYLEMAAESYAYTKDITAAARRLQYWQPQELSNLLEMRAANLAANGEADAALRLRELSAALRLPPAGATPVPASEEGLPAWLRVFFGVAAVLVLALVLAVLIRLVLRAAQERGRQQPAATWRDRPADEIAAPAPTWPRAEAEDDGYEEAYEDEEDWEEEEEGLDLEPLVGAPGSAAGAGGMPLAETPVARPPSGAVATARTPIRFLGNPDFDEIVTIEDGEGEYLGEFGVSVSAFDRDDLSKVRALEIWLFDKSDIRTVTANLLPPQFGPIESGPGGEEGGAIPLQPGQAIRLETESLLVEGQVERVNLAPGGDAIGEATLTLWGGPVPDRRA